jgi:hypothetical protein
MYIQAVPDFVHNLFLKTCMKSTKSSSRLMWYNRVLFPLLERYIKNPYLWAANKTFVAAVTIH